MNRGSVSLRATGLGKQTVKSKERFIKRPLKLLIVIGLLLFFGVYRLRWLLALTFDWSGLYLGYLSGYIGNVVLSSMIDFTEMNYVTRQSWLGQWQGTSITGILPFDSFMNIWATIISFEIVIGVIGILAVYSTLALRRSYLAKIGCLAIILAGIFDVVSQLPIIESIAGVLCFIILIRRDVKDAYAEKEGRLVGKAMSGKEEVTFSADLSSPSGKQRAGKKCPKCGMLLPPSAKVCRRCKTRITE
nr:hypothetical protein [Candidatus Njordarchaeota archaeon]